MNNPTSSPVPELLSAIRNTKKHDRVVFLLEQAVHNVKSIRVMFPGWILSGERKECEDIDSMLSILSNEIKILYNKIEKTLVVAPDLFLSRTAFERLEEMYVSSLHTSTRSIRTAAKSLDSIRVVFMQAECELPDELTGVFPNVFILSPAGFHTLQINWLERFIAPETRLILLDKEHEVDFASNVKKNDINRLEFLIARYDIAKEAKEKEKLLADALAHLEVIETWRQNTGTKKREL